MTVAPISQSSYRPFFQAVIAPVKAIYGVFLRAVGYLLLFLGAAEWGKSLKEKGERIDSSCFSLFSGLWAYGRRFLVYGNNSDESCRGSCYWFIHEHIANREKPLAEIAARFEDGAPNEAIEMHRHNAIPTSFDEQRIWQEECVNQWPPMPNLNPGIYTFLIGYSEDSQHPGKAHRFALIKENDVTYLFDPNTGLSLWEPTDWEPLLDRTQLGLRTSHAGYFTIECYNHNARN